MPEDDTETPAVDGVTPGDQGIPDSGNNPGVDVDPQNPEGKGISVPGTSQEDIDADHVSQLTNVRLRNADQEAQSKAWWEEHQRQIDNLKTEDDQMGKEQESLFSPNQRLGGAPKASLVHDVSPTQQAQDQHRVRIDDAKKKFLTWLPVGLAAVGALAIALAGRKHGRGGGHSARLQMTALVSNALAAYMKGQKEQAEQNIKLSKEALAQQQREAKARIDQYKEYLKDKRFSLQQKMELIREEAREMHDEQMFTQASNRSTDGVAKEIGKKEKANKAVKSSMDNIHKNIDEMIGGIKDSAEKKSLYKENQAYRKAHGKDADTIEQLRQQRDSDSTPEDDSTKALDEIYGPKM